LFFFNLAGADVPGTTLVGCAETVAAGAYVLAVFVAIAVSADAHALAAHAADGLGRTDDDALDAVVADAEGQRPVAVGLELALVEGVVVGGVDDVDGYVAVGVKDLAVAGDDEGVRGRPAVEGEVGYLDALAFGNLGVGLRQGGGDEAEGCEDGGDLHCFLLFFL
jgi:hypothetical protein